MNKQKPPFAGRERGDRCTDVIKPPFHPEGEDTKRYRTSSSGKAPHLGRVQKNILEDLAAFGGMTVDQLSPKHGSWNQRYDVLQRLKDRGFVLDGTRKNVWEGVSYSITYQGVQALKYYDRLPRVTVRAQI